MQEDPLGINGMFAKGLEPAVIDSALGCTPDPKRCHLRLKIGVCV